MPAKLSYVLSLLRGLSIPPVLSPSPFASEVLQKCGSAGTPVEVKLVIDSRITAPLPPSGEKLNEDADNPIVLAFGINYGQGNEYCTPPWMSPAPPVMMDNTGMRPKIDKLASYYPNHSTSLPRPACYHLIVANLFPFITEVAWSELELNAIEEARILEGHLDWAVKLLDLLLTTLAPDFLIFHGANNAVPLFGMSYIHRGYISKNPRANIILCDNLARSGVRIHNCEIL